jgi:hypothetical protein
MSQRRITLILAITCALLGTGHTALTPLIYPQWTENSLWFVGTGLAMLIAAAINIVGPGTGGKLNLSLIVLVNLAMTAFFVAAWPVLRAPQVIVGGVLFAALAVCAVLAARQRPAG